MIDRVLADESINIKEEELDKLIQEYFRVQVANRWKITLENPTFSLEDCYDDDIEARREALIVKHQRRALVHMTESLLAPAIKYAGQKNYSRLLLKATKMIESVWTERPPRHHRIPDYIEHFLNQADQSWHSEDLHMLIKTAKSP